MIPFKLDYVIERTLAAPPCEEQRLIKELAGLRLTPAEARAEWPRVLEHKWFISERLSRDTGLRVAALDYFENVRLPRASRKGYKHITNGLRRAARSQSVTA
jgi:hypothetical protein